MRSYLLDSRSLSKDLIGFQRFVDFIVGSLNGFGSGGIYCEERVGRFFFDDTTSWVTSVIDLQSEIVDYGDMGSDTL